MAAAKEEVSIQATTTSLLNAVQRADVNTVITELKKIQKQHFKQLQKVILYYIVLLL
jgi:hypothetical protein